MKHIQQIDWFAVGFWGLLLGGILISSVIGHAAVSVGIAP